MILIFLESSLESEKGFLGSEIIGPKFFLTPRLQTFPESMDNLK